MEFAITRVLSVVKLCARHEAVWLERFPLVIVERDFKLIIPEQRP